MRDKGFIWNSINWECECDTRVMLVDYEDCNSRKKLVAPLIEECTETAEEVKLITLTENENSCNCSSCTMYTVLSLILALKQQFTEHINGKN